MNSNVIKMNAQKLVDAANEHLLPEDKISLVFKGLSWVIQEALRHKFCGVLIEAKSADKDVIRDKLSSIVRIIMIDYEKNIWNTDKCGLFRLATLLVPL